MSRSSREEDVLAQAIRAWVGFDLTDASVVECATARAIDLYALGSSVAEACQLARNFVTSWLEFGYGRDGDVPAASQGCVQLASAS